MLGIPGRGPMNYAQQLRCVGQAIESLELEDFDITLDGHDYIVEWHLRLKPGDIEGIEREGQKRRRDPNLTPDYSRPSQILRAAGTVVDSVGGRFRHLSKRGPQVLITFQTAEGDTRTEEYTIAMLHDISLKMYLKRAAS
jgi:hypothetical protein